MKANYHTHTLRFGHASGADEDYVRAAIAQGFDELGFSDHVPWPYASGFTHPSVRMLLSQMDEYLGSIRALKKKYADRIAIRVGFECEYFPDYMDWLRETAREKQLDYLILGNHYDCTDEGGMYFGNARTPQQLSAYVERTAQGVETGLFACLAHPDLFLRSYRPFDDNCRAAARELSRVCRVCGVPMEYNLHDRYIAGITHRISYPHPEFFEIARDEGVQVVIGLDAHEPQEIADPTQWNRATQELDAMGIARLERLAI